MKIQMPVTTSQCLGKGKGRLMRKAARPRASSARAGLGRISNSWPTTALPKLSPSRLSTCLFSPSKTKRKGSPVRRTWSSQPFVASVAVLELARPFDKSSMKASHSKGDIKSSWHGGGRSRRSSRCGGIAWEWSTNLLKQCWAMATANFQPIGITLQQIRSHLRSVPRSSPGTSRLMTNYLPHTLGNRKR